jgi:hypothetical protein
MQSRKWLLVIWLALATIRLALGISFIRANSTTGDETLYIVAGYVCLHSGDFSVNSGHPPLSKLLAGAAASLVWDPPYEHDTNWRGGVYRPLDEFFYADRAFGTLDERGELVTMVARVPGMLLGLALCLLCGLWAHRLWGREAGILALGLAVLDPNLLAHSCVVGTDAPLAFFLTLSLYLAWEHARRPSRGLLVGVGLSFGLALATKFSAVVLSPAIALLFLYAYRVTEARSLARALGRTAAACAAVVGIALLVFVSSYGFVGLDSLFFGMGSQLEHQSSGHPAFLLGEVSSEGWWFYFPVAAFAKTPALTLVIVVAAMALWPFRAERRPLETLALVVPAALFFAFNLFLSVNVGIRYLLTVYPFLFVAAGHLVRMAPARAQAGALVASLGVLAATTVPSAPHQIAYFSHFIGGPARGHEWLSDSNIDWGQDLGGLAGWLKDHGDAAAYVSYYGRYPPAYFRIRSHYAPGFTRQPVGPAPSMIVEPAPRYLAISVTNLHGTYTGQPEMYAWLKSHEPIAAIGHSIFIYDLEAIPDAHEQLADAYAAFEMVDFVKMEKERAARARNAATGRAGQIDRGGTR